MASDMLATPNRRGTQLQTPSTLRTRQSFLPPPNSANRQRDSQNSPTKLEHVFSPINTQNQAHNGLQKVDIHRNPSTGSSIGSATSEMVNETTRRPSFNSNGDTLERKRSSIPQFQELAGHNMDVFSPIRKSFLSDPESEPNSARQSFHEATNGSSSASIANAVAQAVSQVQVDAQREIFELQKQIEEYRMLLQDRDIQLDQQTAILKDLESTVIEFQDLSLREAAKQFTENSPNPDDPNGPTMLINQLKKQHQDEIDSILEERDRKIHTIKSQFDEKRNEFRKTIDALQDDLQDSNSIYMREIDALQMKLSEAEKVTERVKELETMVLDLDLGQANTQLAEQESRAQLQRLAESENKLLEKDGRIKELEAQLGDLKSKMALYESKSFSESKDREAFINNTQNNSELESLKKVLEELKKREEKLEKDVEVERKKKEQAERELGNVESMLEDKIFKESELEREVGELRRKVSKLEKDLASKHSNDDLNEFIATGTPVSGGSTTPTIPQLLARKTSASGNGMRHSRENSHHKRFSLNSASGNTDSNSNSMSNSPSNQEISSLLEELPIRSPDIVNPLPQHKSNGSISNTLGNENGASLRNIASNDSSTISISEGYILKNSNNEMKAFSAGSVAISGNSQADVPAIGKPTPNLSTSSSSISLSAGLQPPSFQDFTSQSSSTSPLSGGGIANTIHSDAFNRSLNRRTSGEGTAENTSSTSNSVVQTPSSVPRSGSTIATLTPTRMSKMRKDSLSDLRISEDGDNDDNYESLITPNIRRMKGSAGHDVGTEFRKSVDKEDELDVSSVDIDDIMGTEPSLFNGKSEEEKGGQEAQYSKKPIDLADGRKKWCGLCERDGHDSLECPYENDDLEF